MEIQITLIVCITIVIIALIIAISCTIENIYVYGPTRRIEDISRELEELNNVLKRLYDKEDSNEV